MKETERQIKEQNNLIRLLAQYYKGRDTYRSYRKSKNKKKFRQERRSELELYDQVQKDLKEILGEERFPSIQKLQQEKKRLLEQKKNSMKRTGLSGKSGWRLGRLSITVTVSCRSKTLRGEKQDPIRIWNEHPPGEEIGLSRSGRFLCQKQ